MPGARLLALMLLIALPLRAQHGGIAGTLNLTQFEDRVTGNTASAKGLGAELIGGDVNGSNLYGFASLDFYTVSPGTAVRTFGVFNVGFKIWPDAFEPGLRPWIGGAIGLGGGDRQITPVILGGVSWPRRDRDIIPFASAEYATKYERVRLKFGLMLGG
ncbi:MAG: hypothetical protein KA761_02155 [Gemmatimonadaceae bacterium]|nr:hypothetical protein [Gemmatimonadaceae bacterium]